MITIREIELACNKLESSELPEQPFQHPELCLSETFYPLGFPLKVRTNSAEILKMNDHLWGNFTHQQSTEPMCSDIRVTVGGSRACPSTPAYQYLEPLFISIADPHHYCVVDMARRRTVASITEASLQHSRYIEHFFLMMCLSIIPGQAVHAACVALDGCGVLLCGDSGAGKSTLAYACARDGWEYISDDASFLLDCKDPCVTGNCNLVRFRPSAAGLFPEIKGLPQTPRAAGKPSIELSTLTLPQIVRRQEVKIEYIIFLDRSSSQTGLVRYRKDVARLYMRQGIYATDEIRARHFAAIERLLMADVFQLRYCGLELAILLLRQLVEEGF